MPDTFRAIRVSKTDGGQTVELADLTEVDLMDGDVTIDVEYSTVNYKDALALTGKAPIIKTFPLIPGIDFAGTVRASNAPGFAAGEQVILNGWGVGESHHGGFAELARVRADWLVKVPDGLDTARAMAIGTAGYTAMLSVMALEDQGVKPGDGEILVTGAAGGVGSVAIALLAKLGHRVIASTGRGGEHDYLAGLGAAEIIGRDELSGDPKMLDKERWAGAIDTVGSKILANVIAMTKAGGAVAACGNAAGMDLPTSVAPFILRGVSLIGINSSTLPKTLREEAWARLVTDLDRGKLKAITTTIGFDEIVAAAERIVAGAVRGRVVVEIP